MHAYERIRDRQLLQIFFLFDTNSHENYWTRAHKNPLTSIIEWTLSRRARNVKNSLPLKRNSFFNLDKSHVREHDHNKVFFSVFARETILIEFYEIFFPSPRCTSVSHARCCYATATGDKKSLNESIF